MMDDDDYTSDFEPQTSKRRRLSNPGGAVAANRDDDPSLLRPTIAHSTTNTSTSTNASTGRPRKAAAWEEEDRRERRLHRDKNILGVNAYQRHVQYINDYVLWYSDGVKYRAEGKGVERTDYDVLEEEHRFVWDADDINTPGGMTDEQRFAYTYYKKLFKEYCLADLSRYKEKQLALRWRTQPEVFEGKGHFTCGNLACSGRFGLASWEVPFTYLEHGKTKSTLVKLRLCTPCSEKLNYKTHSSPDPKETSNGQGRGKNKSKSRAVRKEESGRSNQQAGGGGLEGKDVETAKEKKTKKSKKKSKRKSKTRDGEDGRQPGANPVDT